MYNTQINSLTNPPILVRAEILNSRFNRQTRRPPHTERASPPDSFNRYIEPTFFFHPSNSHITDYPSPPLILQTFVLPPYIIHPQSRHFQNDNKRERKDARLIKRNVSIIPHSPFQPRPLQAIYSIPLTTPTLGNPRHLRAYTTVCERSTTLGSSLGIPHQRHI